MTFGISSAPEVFQKKMHELIEGLQGIEVVADDFVVVGYIGCIQGGTATGETDTMLAFFEHTNFSCF